MTDAELREIKERSRQAGSGRGPNKRQMEFDIKILLKEVAKLRNQIHGLGPDDTLEWRECLTGGWVKGIYRENVSDLVS